MTMAPRSFFNLIGVGKTLKKYTQENFMPEGKITTFSPLELAL